MFFALETLWHSWQLTSWHQYLMAFWLFVTIRVFLCLYCCPWYMSLDWSECCWYCHCYRGHCCSLALKIKEYWCWHHFWTWHHWVWTPRHTNHWSLDDGDVFVVTHYWSPWWSPPRCDHSEGREEVVAPLRTWPLTPWSEQCWCWLDWQCMTPGDTCQMERM